MTKVINFQLKFPKRLRRNVKVLKYCKFDSPPIEVLYARKISKIVGIKFDSWVRFVEKCKFYCPNDSFV